MTAHPPGWLRDPTGRHEQRYWDGGRWSEHVSDRGIATIDGARRRPRAGWVVGAAAVAALVTAGVTVAVVRGGEDDEVGTGGRDEIGAVVELTAAEPISVAVGAGAVWIADEDAVLRPGRRCAGKVGPGRSWG